MADDFLIDDDPGLLDDEPLDEYGDLDILIDDNDIVSESGIHDSRTTVTRTYYKTAGVTEKDRSYTEVADGEIRFGYRNETSLRRNVKFLISPITGGISCSAPILKIGQGSIGVMDKRNLDLRIGSTQPATGYLKVITNISRVNPHAGYVHWICEKIPFQNGICVSNRGK